MVDITQHLNSLNRMLQGHKRLVTQSYDTIRAFNLKLSLWKTQLSGDDTAHFLCLKQSGSQTGVRGPFGVRETIFWGPRSTFLKNQHDAPEEKNFV